MACFIVPAAEAIVTTAATKIVEKKEAQETGQVSLATESDQEDTGTPFSRKLKWLDIMLWGGSALLILEHIWHGEITLFFPFFTALESSGGLAVMLTEMATVGVAMAAVVTLTWLGMVLISDIMEKRAAKMPAAARQ